ncbi:MAG: HesA/MoeB/ThiF family protein [Rhodobacteraceae bacterium]|nr:HesA/MoeB/ThiF family protein [Paracoccaceae bacterium]
MVVFLAGCAAIWFIGRYMNAPTSARWTMIGLLYVVVLATTIIFSEGHPGRQIFGGSLSEWLVIGFIAGAVWAYRQVLARLRARVRPENLPDSSETKQAPLERYARHIVLREIGGLGQRKLTEASVLVLGAGGLGSPVLQYLAAAGVGTIGVIDDDVVEGTNLQRQTIHTDARIGMPKVFSAREAMIAQNPFVTVKPYNRRLTESIAADLFAEYDLIIDGTDDVETKYLANRVAAQLGLPLIFGALTQWEGQISVFDVRAGTPCYACVFPNPPAPGAAPSCAEAGVVGPLPGVVGTMMAVEAIKVLTDAGEALRGRMMIYDALYGENRTITLKKRADCPVCGTQR